MTEIAEDSIAEDSIALRQAVIDTARAMNAVGININAAGNVSVRCRRGKADGLLITPTGMAYNALRTDDIVFMQSDGAANDAPITIGTRAPSSEWRFHRDILRTRADINAIVHTHSPRATALACHGLKIPSFHYMVAIAGGADIRCAPYATFGTQALSDHALAALQDRKACLLAHHGVIACEQSLARALRLAIEVEHLARMYLHAKTLALGMHQQEPPLLSAEEMRVVCETFQHYEQSL